MVATLSSVRHLAGRSIPSMKALGLGITTAVLLAGACDRGGANTDARCSDQAGTICSSVESCSGPWLTASDSDRCCSGECSPGPGVTPIYVSIVSHNEDDARYDVAYGSVDGFLAMRDAIIDIAKLVADYGATYEFQSDWRFLKTIEKYETDGHRADTNNKTFLRYLSEDLGVLVEAHSHECATLSAAAGTEYPEFAGGCNYADVAYLIGSFGVVPPPLVGGFLVNPINQADWEKFRAPLTGLVNPGYTWQAEILWGGGSPQHVDDPQLTGVWRPKGLQEYPVDDPSGNLVAVGSGGGAFCVSTLVDDLATGALPAGLIYTTTVMVFELDVYQSPGALSQLEGILRELAPLAASGAVIYAPVAEVPQIWRDNYQNEPNPYDLKSTGTCR